LSSLRHTLVDFARRLQQDTVSEDVGDYVLFVAEIETNLIQQNNTKPREWKRYVDEYKSKNLHNVG